MAPRASGYQFQLPNIWFRKEDPWSIRPASKFKLRLPSNRTPPFVGDLPTQRRLPFETPLEGPQTWRDIIPPAGRSGRIPGPPEPTGMVRSGGQGLSGADPTRIVEGEIVDDLSSGASRAARSSFPRALGGEVAQTAAKVGRFGRLGGGISRLLGGPLGMSMLGGSAIDAALPQDDDYNERFRMLNKGYASDVGRIGKSAARSKYFGDNEEIGSQVDPSDFNLNPRDPYSGPTNELASLMGLDESGYSNPRDVQLPPSSDYPTGSKTPPSRPRLTPRQPRSMASSFASRNMPSTPAYGGLPAGLLESLPEIQMDTNPQAPLESRDMRDVFMQNTDAQDMSKDTGNKSLTAMQRYMDLMSQYPSEESTKPSLLRKILAGMAGASQSYFGNPQEGSRLVNEIVQAPRNKALAEYNSKLDQLEPLARMESQQEIKNQDIEYRKGRDQLINQTKTQENNIKQFMAQNKFITDSQRNEVARFTAEIRQDIANGQLEIAKQKLEELAQYHKELIGIGKQNASSKATSASASALNAKTRAENPTGAKGTSPLVDAGRRARLEKQATDAVLLEMGNEFGFSSASEFQAKAKEDPKLLQEFNDRIQRRIARLMSGGQ